jgi:hypothetical protein
MSTQAQAAANAVNAQSSTGPRTEQGKAVASQNATTHGMTGKSALIAGEDPAEYQAHLDNYTAEHEPITIDEKFLVQQMADSVWRINRIRRIESSIFERAPEGNPFADPALSAELLKLNRYEKSIESTYFRAARELRIIKKEEDKEIREIHKKQASEFSSMIESYIFSPMPPITKRTQSPALEASASRKIGS